MRLSVIIPAYNVADHIEKCIRSLEDQDIPQEDYEIIVTNDGSPDDSQAIVETLQKEFSNIVLINQENQGVSMARNNAIAIAKGEYVMPIDPDDYVLPNKLVEELEFAERLELDVLYLGFEVFDDKGKSIWQTNYSSLHEKIYDGVEGYFAHRGYQVKDPDRSWAIIYKLDLIKTFNIAYPKDVPFLEDGAFLGKIFAIAEKVSFRNTIFYQRTTSKGSATQTGVMYSEKSINGFVISLRDLQKFIKENKLKNSQMGLVNHVVAKYAFLSLSTSIVKFNFFDYLKAVALLNKADVKKIETKGLRMSFLRNAKVYNFSKYLFPFYYRLSNYVSFYFKI